MNGSDLNSIVTFNPTVIEVTTSLVDLLRQMADPEFHHWPVVSSEQQLLGIVSEQDIGRVIAHLVARSDGDLKSAADRLRARTAGEIMTAPVVTVSRWETQLNGLYYLLKHRIHSLPVTEEERLIGLVTTTDYLREFSYGELSVSRQPVSDWVQDGLDPIDCDASLEDADAVMAESGIEQIAVVNGTLPLGVIARRDVRLAKCRLEIRRLLKDEINSTGPTTLRELAAKSPVVRPGARLSEAAEFMVQQHRQAVAVVTQAGRFVGLLSEQTLLQVMAGQNPAAVTLRVT